jgi:response regulator RpfG family c-di-GMP phosphodiesterase
VSASDGAGATQGRGPLAGSEAPGSTRVLIVDDDAAVRDVLSVLLGEEGYACTTCATTDRALDLLHASEFHLVLCDVKMPGKDGLWLLDHLRGLQPSTSVIMLTAYGDTEAAVECLRRGAADYLLKPPKVTELVRSIERVLARRRLELARHRYRTSLERRVREKTAELSRALREIEAAYASTLYALVAALDAREHETSDHSQRVVRYTLAVAERLGLPGGERSDLARGALLHDIGKIGVPDAILLKTGTLRPEEWAEMRRHCQIGHTIMTSIPFLRAAAEIVLAHHERFDGSGYPFGLAGRKIPLGSRIFAIADTFDAITSDRPYRRGASLEAARAEIERCAGTQFDPECVAAFLEIDVQILDSLRHPGGRVAEPSAPSGQRSAPAARKAR